MKKTPNVERIINFSLVHAELVNFVEFLIKKVTTKNRLNYHCNDKSR